MQHEAAVVDRDRRVKFQTGLRSEGLGALAEREEDRRDLLRIKGEVLAAHGRVDHSHFVLGGGRRRYFCRPLPQLRVVHRWRISISAPCNRSVAPMSQGRGVHHRVDAVPERLQTFGRQTS